MIGNMHDVVSYRLHRIHLILSAARAHLDRQLVSLLMLAALARCIATIAHPRFIAGRDKRYSMWRADGPPSHRALPARSRAYPPHLHHLPVRRARHRHATAHSHVAVPDMSIMPIVTRQNRVWFSILTPRHFHAAEARTHCTRASISPVVLA